MQTLKAAAQYFVFVFAAGFVLGTIRVLWIVPILGTRSAELMEMPVMLALSILAARWMVGRLAYPLGLMARLNVGLIALGLMCAAECVLVFWVRGLTLRQYFATRDPVALTAYLIALGGFALMPILVVRRRVS
jgi:hypothetical protein